MSTTKPGAGWVKASRSGNVGDCVELRRHAGGVQVRDSKHPDGPVLTFTPTELAAWLDGARTGEFDHLVGE